MGTHRFNETTWIGLSREVLVELPSHGELGIRVARLLEEFYGGFPIVQAHLDRLVQFAFAKSASPDTTPSVGSDYVNAMLHTVISEAMERIKLAEELLSALEELAKEIRQAQVT